MIRHRGRVGLVTVVLAGAMASGAAADVTTEESASILVFPRVLADAGHDTIIQITNTSNSMVHAHCFYVNAAPVFPDLPPGPGNPPQWQEIDFDISLTKQQPTHWVVSQGRLEDLSDERCSPSNTDCNNAGFDPGRVPPQVEDFVGELKCVEVDASGSPLAGNHLKGEATIVARQRCVPFEPGVTVCEPEGEVSTVLVCDTDADCPGTTGDVSKYNALGVEGLETLNDDPVLCLGGEPTEDCPLGAEYNACPETWILNHLVDSAPVEDEITAVGGGAINGNNHVAGISEDPVLGPGSRVDTSITIVPCTQNFETQVPTSVTIQFLVYDEFESNFSASTTVTCWDDLDLDEISNVFLPPPLGPLDRTFAQTRMRPSNATEAGFMVVASSKHTLAEGVIECAGTAAVNVHREGERRGPDLIVIPADQLQ